MQVLIEETTYPSSPFDTFRSLDWKDGGFLLESTMVNDRLGRWSFFGVEPFLVFTSKGRKTVLQWQDGRREEQEGNQFSLLRLFMERYALQRPADAPPFIGGAAGYFGYDVCQLLEHLPSTAVDDVGLPDCALGLYDVIVAVDHHEKRAFICSSGWPEEDEKKRERRARERLNALRGTCVPHVRGTHDWDLSAVALAKVDSRATYTKKTLSKQFPT